ncbi:hypothetical protein MTR67_004823 [Solanum verrucosum]|uniref:Uncharacterized protein n=1 Tax=Solanum verrucosum TaxID=315347 RepID=A0AAF0TBP6_SOLVR|nr:hypothetical protein MTR67_004823 [Solanum verrucosum]
MHGKIFPQFQSKIPNSDSNSHLSTLVSGLSSLVTRLGIISYDLRRSPPVRRLSTVNSHLSQFVVSQLLSDSRRVLANPQRFSLATAQCSLAARRSVLIASQFSSGNLYFDEKKENILWGEREGPAVLHLMYTTCFGNDQFAVSIIDPTENVSIFYRAEKIFTWLWSRTHRRVTHRAFCCILPVMIDLMIRWFNMTTSLEEPSKKTSRPQLVVLNRAFKLVRVLS